MLHFFKRNIGWAILCAGGALLAWSLGMAYLQWLIWAEGPGVDEALIFRDMLRKYRVSRYARDLTCPMTLLGLCMVVGGVTVLLAKRSAVKPRTPTPDATPRSN